MAPRGYLHVRTYTPLRARSSSPTCTIHNYINIVRKFCGPFLECGGGFVRTPRTPPSYALGRCVLDDGCKELVRCSLPIARSNCFRSLKNVDVTIKKRDCVGVPQGGLQSRSAYHREYGL